MGTKSQKVIAREAAMILAIAIAGLRWTAYAQSEPVFEVSRAPASARSDANRSFDTSLRISRTPQRIAFQAAGLADVIAFAWGLPSDRIEKQPQWMYDDLYNVAVTTASPATLPEQQVMLQKLLEDRFGLVAHPISNPSPVYLLVPGPNVNLTPAREGDAPDSSGFQEGAQPLQSASGSFLPGRRWMGRHVSMSDLAAWLYPRLQLPVLDKTGIPGFFDIEIDGLPVRGGAEGTIHAVKNSLGLDLEVHSGTAETLIIDQVEKLKAN